MFHNYKPPTANAQHELIDACVDHARNRYRPIFGNCHGFDDLDLPRRFDQHFRRNPYRLPDRRTVAIHESGHFVADEVEGFGAWMAKISAPRFGRGGWAGHAQPADGRCFDGLPEKHEATRFVSDARVTLAGPLAEQLIGPGIATNNIAELLEVHLILRRASQLSGAKTSLLWKEALQRTITLVEYYRDEVLSISDVLEKRKQIFRHQRGVKSVLAQAARRPFQAGAASARGISLISDINQAMREFCK